MVTLVAILSFSLWRAFNTDYSSEGRLILEEDASILFTKLAPSPVTV